MAAASVYRIPCHTGTPLMPAKSLRHCVFSAKKVETVGQLSASTMHTSGSASASEKASGGKPKAAKSS